MKYATILMTLLLAGCSTFAPVTYKFPDPPGRQATTPCPSLQKLAEDAKLSDISKTITVNYTTYYECAVKHEAWIEWYTIQKSIADKASK